MTGLALRWCRRTVGIILCATAWLVALGIATLGADWFFAEVPITDAGDALLHGIVALTGPVGGALLFACGGPFLLWAFWQD